LLLLAIGVVGVAVRLAMTGGYLGAAGKVPEDRPAPRTDEEELVRRFIVNNSPDAKRVRFLRWGPHMSRRECLEMAKEAGLDELVGPQEKLALTLALKERLAPFHGFYRVRFRGPEGSPFVPEAVPLLGPRDGPEPHSKGGATPRKDVDHDWLFAVYAKLVIPVQPFETVEEGDNWKKTARKNFSKMLPGIDPDK
jgi:hypothetical protein